MVSIVLDIAFKMARSGRPDSQGLERPLVRIQYADLKGLLFGLSAYLTCRTLHQDYHSWFMLLMGVAKSTVGQIFKRLDEDTPPTENYLIFIEDGGHP